jgi:hypothetical protein
MSTFGQPGGGVFAGPLGSPTRPDAAEQPTQRAETEQPELPSAKGYVLGAVLVVLAIIGASILVGYGIGRAIDMEGSANRLIAVPGGRSFHLEKGRYEVAIHDPYYSGYRTNPDVSVKGPNGTEVQVDDLAPTRRNWSSAQRVIAEFEASTAGTYQVSVTVPDDTDVTDIPGQVKVGRDGNEIAATVVPLIMGGVLGGLVLLIVGVIVLIITGVRRSRARKILSPPAPRPAYPGYPPYPSHSPYWGYPPYGGSPLYPSPWVTAAPPSPADGSVGVWAAPGSALPPQPVPPSPAPTAASDPLAVGDEGNLPGRDGP